MDACTTKRPRILVLEDEPEMLSEIRSVLVAAGYLASCCTTVESAIAAAAADPPDMILANVLPHGANGQQTCERICQQAHLRETPLMFLSASQTPDIIRRRDAAGAAYYIRKPFDPAILIDLIERTLWMLQTNA